MRPHTLLTAVDGSNGLSVLLLLGRKQRQRYLQCIDAEKPFVVLLRVHRTVSDVHTHGGEDTYRTAACNV